MPEITFIFGPNNSFFFDCPKTWKFHGIPHTLRQLFNSSMSPAWRIAQPYCLALAPQINSPEPLWYIGCKVLNGEDKIFYSQTFFDINYPDLARWSKSLPNAPRACYVTFGTNYSYFASAPGHGSIWAGIPSDLSDKVQKAYDTPCNVALGVNNAWFVMWPDGYYSWKFYGHYGALDKILTDAEPRTVSYLAISPYNKEHYFVAFRDRTVKYNFTGAPAEWMKLMQEVFDGWMAEIVQRQMAAPAPAPPAPAPVPQAVAAPQQQHQQQMYSPPPPPNAFPHLQQQQPMQRQWTQQPVAPPHHHHPGAPLVEAPNTAVPAYTSPVLAQSAPFTGYRPPQHGAIEMPGTMLEAPTPVPVRSASTDVSRNSPSSSSSSAPLSPPVASDSSAPKEEDGAKTSK